MSDPTPMAGPLPAQLKITPLTVADRVTSGMYVVPAGHRFRTLAFSLAFSLAGNSLMQVLNGEDGKGNKIEKKDVPFLLRPLHGALEHNKHSDDPADRWKEVAGRMLPIVGAAVGAYAGSYNWAGTSPTGSANLTTARDAGQKLKNGQSIMAAEASIYSDAERGHVARIVGGIFQALGLHSGIHQLFVPSVVNLGIGLGGAFLGANNRALNAVGTDGLKKSTKDMADHVGRNTYNQVLAKMAETDEAGARAFLAESMKLDPVANKEALDKAFKQVKDGGGVDLIETFADRVLNRYFIRAAKDYKASIGIVADDLKTKQGKLVDEWLAKIADPARNGGVRVNPETFQKEIESQGQAIITQAFGAYNRKEGDKDLPFLENDFLKTIRKAGFDETKMEIGERNWVYRVFDWMSGGAKQKASEGLTKHIAEAEAKAIKIGVPLPKAVSVPDAAIKGIGPNMGAALLGGTALASIGGLVAAKPKATPDLFENYRERAKTRGFQGFLNTKVLPKFEFVTRMSIADPSWGRFWLAGGFTLGLLAGDYLMQTPFGRSVNPTVPGSLIGKLPTLPVPGFLKGAEGALAYDPLSGTDRDRWMKTAHTMAVMAFGAMGTFLGARWATKERRAKLKGEGTYLDDFEDRVSFAQGKAWEIPTAIASTPGSALGTTHLGLIPGVNYGANIANYHLLSNGGKIAWQGPGKVMMGSQSRYRFGPVKLIDHMIQYAAYNPDELPKQLVEMSAGIVLPWFPNATPEQVNAFAGELLKIRNEHWQHGGIPAERKTEVIQQMTEHFRGAGLEKTLIGIGLNPAEAVLGNNGLIGTVSEAFGARKETTELKLQFLKKFETRHPEEYAARVERVTQGRHPAASPATAKLAAASLAANDRQGASYASRTTQRLSPQALAAARSGQTAQSHTVQSRLEAGLAPAL